MGASGMIRSGGVLWFGAGLVALEGEQDAAGVD